MRKVFSSKKIRYAAFASLAITGLLVGAVAPAQYVSAIGACSFPANDYWRYDTKIFASNTASLVVDAVRGLPGTYCVRVKSKYLVVDEFWARAQRRNVNEQWGWSGNNGAGHFYSKQIPVVATDTIKFVYSIKLGVPGRDTSASTKELKKRY